MSSAQQINIHNHHKAQQFAPCRASAQIASVPVTAIISVFALPAARSCYAGLVQVSGLIPIMIPGSGLQVTALSFPPSIILDVGIRTRATGYTVIVSGVTDANGTMIT